MSELIVESEFVFSPDDNEAIMRWLKNAGVRDMNRGRTNVLNLLRQHLPEDLRFSLFSQLQRALSQASDSDMALNHFDGFFLAARSRLSLASLFERDPTAIIVLIRIFSTSNYLSELLIRDSEAFDALRMTEGQPQFPEVMMDDICGVLVGVEDRQVAMRTLRRFKQRETLRIAYGDLVINHRLGMVTEQISWLAQSLCQGALEFCDRQLRKKWGTPRDASGNKVDCVIIAMGKLGGRELNYSSDIDLVAVHGASGETDGPRTRSNQDYFEELIRDFTKLMSENTVNGFAWRVDWRLRPDGQKGRLSLNRDVFLRYYEQKGRVWERQALIKARPVAGNLKLGEAILHELEPWCWKQPSYFEITAVKSLKRQIERRATVEGGDLRDVKTGRGGIRDIEFTTQFLQLLYGPGKKEIRQFNTLRALEQLEKFGCLTLEEETVLARNYIWLRKLEHRLQIMSDLQTHRLPDNEQELQRIALRMGYVDAFGEKALQRFQSDFEEITTLNRRILDHQLHEAFADQPEGESVEAVDLIFTASVDETMAREALGSYRFDNPLDAARRVQALATEPNLFLSASRCRHFLAAVLPRLLREIDATANPDRTLASLHSVAGKLGGKGLLWELFHTQPGTMQLFVRLCSQAGYLVGILRDNPGMIDELMDSLLVGQLPDRNWLRDDLLEVAGRTIDPMPIIQSFKQAQHLRIGAVDLMGGSSIVDINRALSDVADVCLESVANQCWRKTVASRGVPQIVDRDGNSRMCNVAIIALGKLGGRELNYQSDLDLMFVFESDGQTNHHDPSRQTSNQHFFSDWAGELTRVVSTRTASGRLYELDSRLRPTGKSGSLATSASGMERYFSSGQGQVWESLAMCKGRVVWSSGQADFANALILHAITCRPWSQEILDEIVNMRTRLEQHVMGTDNLKRGIGGTVDIEFAVQAMQMRYVGQYPQLRNPSAPESLQLLSELKLLPDVLITRLESGFHFLRTVESSLRLCDETPHHSLSAQPDLTTRIARMLRIGSGDELLERVATTRDNIRQAFLAVVELLKSR